MILLARRLFDGTNDQIEHDCYIRIDGEAIVEIASSQPKRSSHEPLIEIPADITVMPGLIDAHDHPQLRIVDNKQDDYFAANERELFARMITYCHGAVAHGVTTVRECGSSHHMGLTLAKLVNGGNSIGPRILSCGNPITSIGGHLAWMGREVGGPEQMAAAVQEELDAGAVFIKITASGGMASAGTNIYDAQFPDEALQAAVATAHQSGKQVATHAHSTASIQAVTRAGVDTIEHCSWAGPDGPDYDPEAVNEMVRKNITVVFTLATGYPRDRIKERWQRMIGTLEQRLEAVGQMIDAGVPTIVGTDDSAVDTVPWEIELMSRAGLGRFGALKSATSYSAERLGIGDVTGSVEPGKAADIIGVCGNPLEDLSALGQVAFVMTRGRLVRQSLPT